MKNGSAIRDISDKNLTKISDISEEKKNKDNINTFSKTYKKVFHCILRTQ